MRRLAYLALTMVILAVLASVMHGQTISPVYTECRVKCSGSFDITNNSLIPMVVSVEPRKLSFTDTTANFTALDPNVVEIKLSETSARLSPRETHSFDYKVKCLKTPCAVTFQAGMIIGHTKDGMAVKLILSSNLYICEKEKGCRMSILPNKTAEVAKGN